MTKSTAEEATARFTLCNAEYKLEIACQNYLAVVVDELLVSECSEINPTPSPPAAPASIPIKIRTMVLSTNVSLPALNIKFPLPIESPKNSIA